MGDGVWGVRSGCVGDGKMLRGMCERSSVHYKKRFLGFQVVKYPRFIAQMYVLAHHFVNFTPIKKALLTSAFASNYFIK